VAQLAVCWLRSPMDSAWPPTIDERLRAGALAELNGVPGFRAGWVGRNDPTARNERVIASLWEDDEPPAVTALVARLLGSLDGSHTLEQQVARITIEVSFTREAPATILRVYQGLTVPGMLERYFDEARTGTLADGADPMGPLIVVSGAAGADSFLTISTWSSWSCIEACTGGDIRRPLATRNAAWIASGGPVHYEILSELSPTPATPAAPADASTMAASGVTSQDADLQAH
jgi:hypothetical protein